MEERRILPLFYWLLSILIVGKNVDTVAIKDEAKENFGEIELWLSVVYSVFFPFFSIIQIQRPGFILIKSQKYWAFWGRFII
jgi:hypothetical protein